MNKISISKIPLNQSFILVFDYKGFLSFSFQFRHFNNLKKDNISEN